jgi:molybdenum cofactor cytidylyltransferase
MIAGLLLAGGASRRFGSNKLVAPLGGRPVVRWSAEALAAAVDVAYVVVPTIAEGVREALDGVAVRWVENRDAPEGLASSIRAGVSALPADVDAVVITLGDQPLVGGEAIRRVVAEWRDAPARIRAVATEYADGREHPALFGAALFPALCALEGDRGARELLTSLGDAVQVVHVGHERPADVDTMEALERLNSTLPKQS